MLLIFFFFQAEDGIRDLVRSRGLGDVYKRQALGIEGHRRSGSEGTNEGKVNLAGHERPNQPQTRGEARQVTQPKRTGKAQWPGQAAIHVGGQVSVGDARGLMGRPGVYSDAFGSELGQTRPVFSSQAGDDHHSQAQTPQGQRALVDRPTRGNRLDAVHDDLVPGKVAEHGHIYWRVI